MHLKWSCVFHPIAWLITLPWQKISFSHIYCTPNLYPFKKDLILYSIFARAFFLEDEIFTKNANFLLLIWQNSQLIMIMWCSHMFSLLCPILTHCDPRKSSIFPIFVIFVIYRPRFCPFVHFVIVLYCIYAFWDVNIISVIALYIALRGTRKIYMRSTISAVGKIYFT